LQIGVLALVAALVSWKAFKVPNSLDLKLPAMICPFKFLQLYDQVAFQFSKLFVLDSCCCLFMTNVIEFVVATSFGIGLSGVS